MIGTPHTPVLPTGGFGIGVEQVTAMTRDHDFSALQEYGGASVLIAKPYKLNHLFSGYLNMLSVLLVSG